MVGRVVGETRLRIESPAAVSNRARVGSAPRQPRHDLRAATSAPPPAPGPSAGDRTERRLPSHRSSDGGGTGPDRL